MKTHYEGDCGSVALSVPSTANQLKLVVAPQAVVSFLVSPIGDEANLALEVGAGAGVHLVLTQFPRRGEISATVEAGATYTVSLLGVATQSTTCLCTVRLAGDGANAHVQVASVGVGESQTELTCTVEHVAKHTFARITARRVETGASSSAFRGMLKVGVDAHGTDTYLSDKALLLGERARAESVPGLEILADDVRASHGATVGQISSDELFYLRSRGLPKAEAERLLVRAFLAPALVGVPADVSASLLRNLDDYA